MPAPDTNTNADQIGLNALAWTLGDPDRAQRLLATTGLDPADLRERIGEPAVLAAALAFLEGHEPDLIACAADLGVTPQTLVIARTMLEHA